MLISQLLWELQKISKKTTYLVQPAEKVRFSIAMSTFNNLCGGNPLNICCCFSCGDTADCLLEMKSLRRHLTSYDITGGLYIHTSRFDGKYFREK